MITVFIIYPECDARRASPFLKSASSGAPNVDSSSDTRQPPRRWPLGYLILAEGFVWSEGPTWFEGSVLFSDVPDNVIYRWKRNETSATVFMKPGGLLNSPAGFSPGFREPGSNGLAVDADGRLLICQQGGTAGGAFGEERCSDYGCGRIQWQALQLAQRLGDWQKRRRILH
jgi:hypothetical protein